MQWAVNPFDTWLPYGCADPSLLCVKYGKLPDKMCWTDWFSSAPPVLVHKVLALMLLLRQKPVPGCPLFDYAVVTGWKYYSGLVATYWIGAAPLLEAGCSCLMYM
ncbi:hypothetical protein Nepgr_017452 [Nepenthes gracilis]|uniref:Uncharacterized protein n=1 Tax=Nepenthes gracilis TaxID=150966 RepID=A0AAD3SS25_NEPGR|nr:hypothetical protein Nepgr_017452 [Nepenthes gracilis]